MKTIKAAILMITVVMLLSPAGVFANKYAVLASGGIPEGDDVEYSSEYWYDLFNAYTTLINHGFTHQNIIVCYGEGSDFVSAHPCFQNRWTNEISQITDFNNHKASIQQAFANLNSVVTSDDTLIFWWAISHGMANNMDDYYASISNSNEDLYDYEIANYLDQVTNYKLRIVLWATCRSGGMRDNCQNNKTIVLTACEYWEDHQSNYYCGYPHADFTFYVTSFYNNQDLCGNVYNGDDNGNAALTIDELQSHIQSSYLNNYNTVCIADTGNLASSTELVTRNWVRGLNFTYDSGILGRIPDGGWLQSRGVQQTWTASGLIFRNTVTGNTLSLQTNGIFTRDGSYSDQNDWLSDTNNLIGNLVFKNNAGIAGACFTSGAGMYLRSWPVENYPPFQ